MQPFTPDTVLAKENSLPDSELIKWHSLQMNILVEIVQALTYLNEKVESKMIAAAESKSLNSPG